MPRRLHIELHPLPVGREYRSDPQGGQDQDHQHQGQGRRQQPLPVDEQSWRLHGHCGTFESLVLFLQSLILLLLLQQLLVAPTSRIARAGLIELRPIPADLQPASNKGRTVALLHRFDLRHDTVIGAAGQVQLGAEHLLNCRIVGLFDLKLQPVDFLTNTLVLAF